MRGRVPGVERPIEVAAPGTHRFPRNPAETQSWYIEQALDVEWAHAVAPRAKIVYVGAANDARGLDLALNYAVDHHVADVISNSWGLPEAWVSRGEIGNLPCWAESSSSRISSARSRFRGVTASPRRRYAGTRGG